MSLAESGFHMANSSPKGNSTKSNKNILIRKLLIIAGVPIDNLTMDESLDRIIELIRMGRADGRTRQVATVNADFVVKAAEDPELRFILQESDLATPDGMPLVWGARALGVDIEERVAGADMIPALATKAAENGLSIYLFGSVDGVAEKAAEILKDNNPGLNIVGTASPPFTSLIDMDPKYVEDIRAKKPDILLVALGNPKQEKFISMHKNKLGAAVAIGIGGTLDFIAGKQTRAPIWMQNTGTEWMFRMFSDPKRLVERYYNDLTGFSRFFISQWWHMRAGKGTTADSDESKIIMNQNKAVVNLRGRIDMTNNRHLTELLEAALLQTEHIELDLEHVTFLDSVAIGTILAFTRIARDRKGDVNLINVPRPLMKTLNLLKLDRFFELRELSQSASIKELKTIQVRRDSVSIPVPSIFDATTSDSLIQTAMDNYESEKSLILDFSNTRLLTSAGLAAVVRINREVVCPEGEFFLANCSEDVLRILNLVKFDAIYPIIETD